MKNNLYAMGLTVLAGLYGCGDESSVKTETPVKTEPSTKIELQTETPKPVQKVNHNLQGLIGTYAGLVNGIPAKYEVQEDSCYLTLHFPKRMVGVLDEDCNNEAEEVATPNLNYTGSKKKGLADIANRYYRIDLTASFKEDVDPWLKEGWKLVRPENEVYRYPTTELGSLFQP